MADRLNNDFQFLDVPRQDPEKKEIDTVKLSLSRSTNRLKK
jgi:glutamate synthase (NADPH/NADH) small chain